MNESFGYDVQTNVKRYVYPSQCRKLEKVENDCGAACCSVTTQDKKWKALYKVN